MAHENVRWQKEGLCLEMGNAMFFSREGQDINAAKLICSMCPVQRECLNYAMRTKTKHGVWGGLTGDERFDLRISSQWNGGRRAWAYGYKPGEV